MNTQDGESLHAVIRGRVQGVGFRAFVIYNAQGLGLRGFARNLGDARSVEVQAEGPREHLESLLVALHRGPSASRVESVEVTWGPPTGTYVDFGVG